MNATDRERDARVQRAHSEIVRSIFQHTIFNLRITQNTKHGDVETSMFRYVRYTISLEVFLGIREKLSLDRLAEPGPNRRR